jgi:hypothetical protein
MSAGRAIPDTSHVTPVEKRGWVFAPVGVLLALAIMRA